jgi:thiol-disulfide isomerase/thioredoxin
MPAFEQVHQELGDQALIIGVNVRDAPSPATRTADRTGVTYPLVRDPEGTTLLALGGVSMPTTVLVAGDGTVAEVISRPLDAAELRSRIEGLAG